MAENAFRFPLLSSKALAENMLDIIPNEVFTVDDFKKPQANRMQLLYSHLLEILLGKDMKSLMQPQFNALQCVTSPEIMQSTTPLIHFALALQRVLKACCVTDFKIQDLLQPKPKSTRRFLSAIINFFRFREQRLETFEMCKQEIDARHQQYAGQMKNINELKERINHIRASRAEEEAQINQLKACIEEENTGMSNKQRMQVEAQKTISQTKTGLAEKNARLEQLNVSCLNSCESGDELRKQVVQSPERMKADIHRMHMALAARKQTKMEKVQRLHEIRAQNEQGGVLVEWMEQGINLLQASHVEVEKQRNAQVQIEKKRDLGQEKKSALRDVTAKVEYMARQKETKQEKLSKMQLQHQHAVMAQQENIQHTDRTVNELMVKQEKKYGQIQTVREDQSMLQKQLEEKENLHAEKMSHLKEKYNQMLRALDVYHEKLAVAWENNNPQKILTENS